MSANCGQLNNNEDSEVMVRQVNLAAAFHDHISCTKMSQHSIGTGICGLQSVEVSEPQNAAVGSELSVAFESDHMYATESKSYSDNNVSANGCIGRPNSLFNNSQSEERNQISKLTEMILGQLDLIQHQQEQLLKKDRQLQGLKQDREALCLRLEKMEKRIAVLSAKVANNAAQTVITSNSNSVSVNANSNTVNPNRNVVNKNSQTVSVGVETDCDQSSDTIVEEASGGQMTPLNDSKIFTKLYSNSSAVNSSVNSVNKSTTTSKPKPLTTPAVPINKIKTEPQDPEESETSFTTANSQTTVRKSRKRQPELVPTAASSSSTVTSPKKRSKPSVSSDIVANEDKKEILGAKETSCDSFSTSQTTINTNLTKTLNNKKKVRPKSESSSRVDIQTTSTSLNLKTVTKDVLMTSKPYKIAVNMSQSPLDMLSDSEVSVNNTECEEQDEILDQDVIEVPSWRLHPVSSCYSLEGTENLDDEVFNRRHLKLENDEKRRKRWDIQRLREHRYNEKLRTGRYYNNTTTLNNCFVEKPSDLKNKSLDFGSFYPEIKNLQYIEVAEKIPVVAFGHPIPKLPLISFSLPWNAGQKPSGTAAKERKSGKSC